MITESPGWIRATQSWSSNASSSEYSHQFCIPLWEIPHPTLLFNVLSFSIISLSYLFVKDRFFLLSMISYSIKKEKRIWEGTEQIQIVFMRQKRPDRDKISEESETR